MKCVAVLLVIEARALTFNLLRDSVYSLCTCAANNNGVLPMDADASAVTRLVAQGLAQRFDTGEIVLTHDAMRYGVACSAAVPERTTREVRTALEMKRTLADSGWSFTRSARGASVAGLRGVSDNPRVYYQLLMAHKDAIGKYEAAGVFSHAQSQHYYNTVWAAIEKRPAEIVEIPFSKPVDFYEGLTSFTEGAIVLLSFS